MKTKTVNILGSSGSIGTQAADVVSRLGYRVRAISVGRNIDVAKRQITEFHPEICAVVDEDAGRELEKETFGSRTKIIVGKDAPARAAEIDADVTLNAISGFAGLLPTMAALSHAPRLAIANKETLVAAGTFVKAEAKRNGTEIIPVDSEHSAIFQCLNGGRNDVKRLILTCSGGAFFGKTADELKNVTLASALDHPTWNMGGKITVDCATLMNKGLEVIEAMHLFDIDVEKISVVIHRESIIHSMVEYADNAILAQLGSHDMRIPIQYALTYPERTVCPASALDFEAISRLTFAKPDTDTFPSLLLAYDAARRGDPYPCVMNAANEVAVGEFMRGRISFPDIYAVTKETLDAAKPIAPQSVGDVVKIHEASVKAAEEIAQNHRKILFGDNL